MPFAVPSLSGVISSKTKIRGVFEAALDAKVPVTEAAGGYEVAACGRIQEICASSVQSHPSHRKRGD